VDDLVHSGSQKGTPIISLGAPILSLETTRLEAVSLGLNKASFGSTGAPIAAGHEGTSVDLAKLPNQATTGAKVVDEASCPGCAVEAPGLSRGSKDLFNEIAREKRERKATKADDAKVPEFLWEEHMLQDCPTPWVVEESTRLRQAMVLLHTRMLNWWKRRVARSFLAWVKREYPELAEVNVAHTPVVIYDGHRYDWRRGKGKNENLDGLRDYNTWWKSRMLVAHADLLPGADAVRRAAESSWWNWDDGSRPFHWRWPRWYQGTIRDGLEVHFQGKKLAYRKAQRCSPEQDARQKMREKL
jgi:hypothetical protein